MTAALDIERFTKVRGLMLGGATPGEREAAKNRAESMARAAGLTFRKACETAEATKIKPAAPAPTSQAESFAAAMSAVFNTPEARAERAEREMKRHARCRELLAEYGSEDAVFADTPREAALRVAVEPFRAAIDAWGMLGTAKNLPPDIRAAVTAGWPLPDTVAGVWAEFHAADRLSDHRCALEPAYDDWEFVRARTYVLESALDTMPALTMEDVRARFDWMEHLNGQGFSRDVQEDTALLATLRADVERLLVQSGQTDLSFPVSGSATVVQSGRGTAGERRRAILSILDDPATSGLSDREIARRVGASPSTVGNLRRKRDARP